MYLVRLEAEMEKKVDLLWLAIHLPIRVLPVPGGPNSSKPLGGPLERMISVNFNLRYLYNRCH